MNNKQSNVNNKKKQTKQIKEEFNKEVIKKKSFSLLIAISFMFIYLELLNKIFVYRSLEYYLNTILFTIPFIILLYFICNIFKEKGNKVILSMCFL